MYITASQTMESFHLVVNGGNRLSNWFYSRTGASFLKALFMLSNVVLFGDGKLKNQFNGGS